MPPRPRRLIPPVATLLALTAASPATAAAQYPKTIFTAVSYRGYAFQIPQAWPVIDLTTAPTTCVRFDQHAVYLGTPGAAQSCPARVIGRTEALLIEPAALAAATQITDEQMSHEFDATAPGITVTATYNTDRTLMQTMLVSALPTNTTA